MKVYEIGKDYEEAASLVRIGFGHESQMAAEKQLKSLKDNKRYIGSEELQVFAIEVNVEEDAPKGS